ncbi:MAG: MFS transporter, partial [Rhodospirillales bacterium]|nr:MFS transporter [Rhodospirillales bacterium]
AVPVGLITLYAMEEDKPAQRSSLRQYLVETGQGLGNPRMLGLMSVVLTLTMINHGITLTFLPIFMADSFHASALTIGLILSVRIVVGAGMAALMGHLSARFSGEILISLSLGALCLSLVWLPLVNSVWGMIGPAILAGGATGVGFPAFQSLLVRAAPADVRAGVMAANSVMGRIGQTAGPVLAGPLFVLGGANLLFIVGALFIVVMWVLLHLALRRPSGNEN